MHSSRANETSSNYGYALGPIGSGVSGVGDGDSHYYSGVYPGANLPSSRGASVYKAYSNVQTEPLTSSQTPLTIIDPPCEPVVQSYIAWSLFNLFCCGLLFGLVATVFSLRVMSLSDRRSIKEAQKLSQRVLFGNMVVTMLGVFLWILIFPYVYVAVYPYLPKINY